MATLLGTDTFQKQNSTNPAAKPDGSAISGDIREITGTYTCTGSELTGDTLPLFKLPIGASLREMYVSTDGVGGTSVIFSEIGDAGDADRYATTDIALTAAGVETKMTARATNALAPFAVDTAANQTVTGTITHGGAPTAGKVIVLRASYRMP
jgi:hypothetical protein